MEVASKVSCLSVCASTVGGSSENFWKVASTAEGPERNPAASSVDSCLLERFHIDGGWPERIPSLK